MGSAEGWRANLLFWWLTGPWQEDVPMVKPLDPLLSLRREFLIFYFVFYPFFKFLFYL